LSHPLTGGTWSSPHAGLFINIDPATGLITGLAGGVATIYYRVGTCIASTNVKVHSLPTTIHGPANVCLGATISLVSLPTGGTWSASNSTATIAADGEVHPLMAGIDTFYYHYSNMCGSTVISKSVNIDTLPGPITGPMSICAGQSATLTCTGSGMWISTEWGPSFIGTYTGIYSSTSLGSWRIKYQLPTGCAVYASVTVNAYPVISGVAGYACIGVPKSLSANIPGGYWISDNTSVVEIDSVTGIAVGVSVGTANVSYFTSQGCSATEIITTAKCPTDVSTVPQTSNMIVSPNPANSVVSISVSKAEGQLSIWNMTGKKVAEQKVCKVNSSFDVGELASGVYLIIWEHDFIRELQRLVIK
jgi:hypothetical protein